MKKLIISLFIVLLTISSASAQRIFLEYNIGYGTFNMSDMRHTLLKTESVVKGMKITDDFPGFLIQDAKVGFSYNRWDSGVLFGYMATGGKKSLADYSGSYKNEIKNKGFKTGLFARYCLMGQDFKLKLYAQGSVGTIFTNAKLIDEINLNANNIHEREEAKINGTNLFVQPALIIQYHIIKPLAVQAQIGYEWSPYKGKMRYEGNKLDLKADWDGLRASVGFVVYLTN